MMSDEGFPRPVDTAPPGRRLEQSKNDRMIAVPAETERPRGAGSRREGNDSRTALCRPLVLGAIGIPVLARAVRR